MAGPRCRSTGSGSWSSTTTSIRPPHPAEPRPRPGQRGPRAERAPLPRQLDRQSARHRAPSQGQADDGVRAAPASGPVVLPAGGLSPPGQPGAPGAGPARSPGLREPHGRHRPVGWVRGGGVRAVPVPRRGGRAVVDRSVRLLPGRAGHRGLAATRHHDPVRPAHLLHPRRRRRAAQPVRGSRRRLQRPGDPRRDPLALPAAHQRLGGGRGGRADAARHARVPRAGPRDLHAAQRRGGQPLLHSPTPCGTASGRATPASRP